MQKRAIIIGAGPAGLTAAYELLKRTDVIPIVLEKSEYIGGISRTVQYKGNRMDMGPHRFFSKSDRVMDWWLHIMPLEEKEGRDNTIHYQHKSREINSPQTSPSADPAKRMLVIKRLTRIYFLRKFFAYPLQLTVQTLSSLGLVRTTRIVLSYLQSRLFPIKNEQSLEDFIINRFGKELYQLFFRDYTQKVWGVPCNSIPAEWGAQRIKGISLSKAIGQAMSSLAGKKKGDARQKGAETSLIEQFLYPKHGPGSLWEEVARQIQEMGGQIYLQQDVQEITSDDSAVTAVHTYDALTGNRSIWEGDYFFSTMPVQELVASLGPVAPAEVKEIAAGLQYRDFINVGVLLKQLSRPTKHPDQYQRLDLKDNWIYIQERDVMVGRLMIYNNWGDGMIADPNTTWIGMEYFCNKDDAFWELDDEAIQQHAILELQKMELANPGDVLDTTVRRMEKTYPAYFGSYQYFEKIRDYVDSFPNLFLIGRNGMHKYNNADHSMLTAMVAVDNIVDGVLSKGNIWAVNTEQEYHEEKAPDKIVEKKLENSFFKYLWTNRWNKAYLALALCVYILQFFIFKTKYPFANYMPDSYSYLEAASSNADVNMWPVAYSKFLRLISVFTHSDKILVGIQFIFMQAATLFFLFSFLYFLRPGKVAKTVLMVFVILNPVPLYIANYVSADALFIGLSLLWASTLVWMIWSPRPWQLWVHAILLLACFTVRYNAIYYPPISLLTIFLTRQRWAWRLGGTVVFGLLLLYSLSFTSQKMKEISGTRQFSAFGGWQLANNALYMYQHIPAAERKQVPARFTKLEKMVRQHMDTLQKVKFTHEDSTNSFFYLWSGRGPLIQYLKEEYKNDSITPYFKRWASEGPLYLGYAQFLVQSYPLQFLQYFMVPNAIKLAVPPTEFLGTYNMGGDSVGRLAKDWFQYKSQKVKDHNNKTDTIWLTEWYPIFTTMASLLFIIHLVGLFVFGSLKNQSKNFIKTLIIITSLLVLNAGFSIFSSPIVLRYQVFPILLGFILAIIAGEIIYRAQPVKNTI